ncbi:high nitrogen upregulated cytochrome P450 monooxygenase 2 [Obba rivulosa]|uniref:High nitrogen upregulated cytochrome P450 monooxygenase 2 n=1 Tax=Obba rivulosa TaxID=1052685 RepID=A0A8E2DGA5_9APHY|nr:high nitrogen upregulated cytochrome P450 monooxygenase 2 [Obba rivulosa]
MGFSLFSLIPQPRLGDTLLLIATAAVGVHGIFKRYEPPEISHHAGLLFGVPSVLSLLLWNHYSPARALVIATTAFLSALTASVAFYRLGPLHPLAKYPGPPLLKLSRLPLTWVAMQGKEYLFIQKLHERYGDIVRISPNEVSVRDASAIVPMMGSAGLTKGPHWQGRSMRPAVPSVIAMTNPVEHLERRKLWNRAFNTTALKGYEHIIARRANLLVETIAEAGEVDLATRISWFTFDFMSDLVFGGGSDMLRQGDEGSVWRVINRGMVSAHMLAHLPWTVPYAQVLGFGEDVRRMRSFGIERAKGRVKAGSLDKDLFYYLNNEDGAGAPRPFPEVVSDGALAVIAGSDTTSSVLSNVFFYLLKEPAYYKRLQAEVDKFYPPGEDALSTKHHGDMPFLTAVLHESMRLFPALPTGSQRAPVKGSGGKLVGQYFIPEGTSTFIHSYSVHRDPRNFFPNSETFWPERWLIAAELENSNWPKEMEKSFIHNATAFIPFSFGPANCVGKNLALQEMRMVVCLMMQKLEMRFPKGFDPRAYEENLQDYLVVMKPSLPVLIERRPEAWA